MRAALYREFGPASSVLRIEELDDQPPRHGEVRVALKASGVNPSDVKNRAGLVMPAMPYAAIVPHSDGAGIISDVGVGVDAAWMGKRVWVWNAQFKRPFGTAAEFVTLPVAQVEVLPDNVGFAEGASLGIPAMTAYRSVVCGTSVTGQTVLVAGGSGHVGRFAIQMAKALGSKAVIATVGNWKHRAVAEAAGADAVLLYNADDLQQQVEDVAGPRGVDRIVEVEWGTNHALDLAVIRPEGEIYVYGSAFHKTPPISTQHMMLAGVTVHYRSVYLLPTDIRLKGVEALNGWLAGGKVTVPIAARFALREIACSHQAVEKPDQPGHVVVDIA